LASRDHRKNNGRINRQHQEKWLEAGNELLKAEGITRTAAQKARDRELFRCFSVLSVDEKRAVFATTPQPRKIYTNETVRFRIDLRNWTRHALEVAGMHVLIEEE
jgi:hypothetical protein